MDKSYIFLKSPIGSGGEANIYTVQINSELVAKVYHQPHGDYARQLAFMVANPPVDPLAKEGRVSIAWATELVTDLGLVVGFLMPKLDTSKAKPIFQYYNPSERRKESPTFSYVSLLRTARNLARAVRSVHSRGYVIGDVNESNVLVAEDAIVTLVDTDSFQVNDGTTVYRCTVGKPEYTPPELQGMSFRDVDRSVEHDLFGLGVLIYQLLMEGTHPFGGVFRGQGEAPELQERIKAGHFPHGRRGIPYKPMPLAPSFQMLPVALQELFLLCFEVGHGNPAARPTAEVWSKALGVAEDGLVRCGVNGQHYYSGHLGVCPWCERAAKLGGRDPFPALGAISSGQHLKPAAIIKTVGKPTLKAQSNSPPPTRKPSTPNPVPSSVVPPQFVNATSLTSSQPQQNFQTSISSNLVSNNSQISSSSTVATKQSGSRISHWKRLVIISIVLLVLIAGVVWQTLNKEIQTLKGHGGSVTSVAFSPDGKMIATGSVDNTVKLWSLEGKELQTLKGSAIVSSVAFSPDGKMIAADSDGKTIKLWNLEGKEIQTFQGHGDPVISVAFSPDGKTIATGSYDNTVELWNLESKEIQTFKGHSGDVYSVAFSPDGKTIASGSWDDTIKLWNLEGKELQTFKGHKYTVYSVAFSPDGKTIASGSMDRTVKLWDLQGKELQTFKGHSGSVYSVAFSPDGKTIASGSGDETVKLWNLEGKEIQTFQGHSNNVNSVAFSSDGKMIASGSLDNTVKLWKVKN
ncbi:MAG: protein kinase domain-containing protein [Pseudanabaena sp.]